MKIDPFRPDDWVPYSSERASEAAVRLHDYWASKRQAPDMVPSRGDIRPEEIKPLLPFLWIMDFERQTRTFRYRLIGTAVVEGVGRDYTGRTLDECHPNTGAYEFATRALMQILEDRQPLWRRGVPMFHHETEALRLENLALPLASDRRTADQVLGLTLFFDSEDRLYRPGVIRAT